MACTWLQAMTRANYGKYFADKIQRGKAKCTLHRYYVCLHTTCEVCRFYDSATSRDKVWVKMSFGKSVLASKSKIWMRFFTQSRGGKSPRHTVDRRPTGL